MSAVFAASDERAHPARLGSNLGHLITAAGVAGVLKVLGALRRAGVRPSHARTPTSRTPALAGTPFRLLARAERESAPAVRR